MKVFPIVGAVLSVVSLILLAVGAATNKWVILMQGNNSLNPTIVNTKLETQDRKAGITSSTSAISYVVANYGLWIGCHKEQKGAVSCAYIGASCYSDVCWIRKTSRSSSTTCLDGRVHVVSNCVAYQVVRVFVLLGVVVMVVGIATQLVSLVTVNRTLAMLGGVVLFGGGVLVMIAFAVFYSELVAKSGVLEYGRVGYSLKLVLASWPITMIGALVSCFAASLGIRHKEVSDYSASNY